MVILIKHIESGIFKLLFKLSGFAVVAYQEIPYISYQNSVFFIVRRATKLPIDNTSIRINYFIDVNTFINVAIACNTEARIPDTDFLTQPDLIKHGSADDVIPLSL
jgi:hypothetical protein